MTSTGKPPPLPTSQNGPSRFGRVEAFWNSFSCDPSIAALQSVPAFPVPQWAPVLPVRSRDSMPALGVAVDGQRKRIKARKDSRYIFLSLESRVKKIRMSLFLRRHKRLVGWHCQKFPLHDLCSYSGRFRSLQDHLLLGCWAIPKRVLHFN